MTIKVIAFSTDFIRNVTEVRIQISENVGRIERIKDELIVPLEGRFEIVNDDMMNALFLVLCAEGMDPFPEESPAGPVK
jgi:hypothetical protein